MATIQHTQQAINKLGVSSIKVDNILGHKETIPALIKLSEKLENVFEQKQYKLDAQMLVGIRMDEVLDNMFTDLYIYWDRENSENTRCFPCSVNPGLYGQGSALNPIWHGGIYGVAILKAGQYLNAYSYQGAWWSGKPFLYQIRPVTVYRDNTRDVKIDRVQEQTGLFGINHHSWIGHTSNWVNTLSQGCQVFRTDVHDLILPYWQELSRKYNNEISYTLINKKDLDI